TETPKPDWRVEAADIDAHATANDLIYFYGTTQIDRNSPGGYYLALSRYAKKMPRVGGGRTARAGPGVVWRGESQSASWVVVPDEMNEPADLLPGFRPDIRSFSAFLPRIHRWVRDESATMPTSQPR